MWKVLSHMYKILAKLNPVGHLKWFWSHFQLKKRKQVRKQRGIIYMQKEQEEKDHKYFHLEWTKSLLYFYIAETSSLPFFFF